MGGDPPRFYPQNPIFLPLSLVFPEKCVPLYRQPLKTQGGGRVAPAHAI